MDQKKLKKILKTLKEAQGRMLDYEPSIDYEEMATDMGDLLETVIPEMQEALRGSTKPIFAALPFSPGNVEIVEIKCLPKHEEPIKRYLIDKLAGDPRFGILPLDPKNSKNPHPNLEEV